MSTFVDRVAASLAGNDGVQRGVARHHGEHRSKTSSPFEDISLEYACLLRLTCDMAIERGDPLSAEEVQVLAQELMVGAAESAHAHASYHQRIHRQRDAEHFAFIAHDLRNPLASIRYAWQLLSMKGQLPSSEPVAVIDRALNRLIERLDFSLSLMQKRSGTENTEHSWNQVDIDQLIRDACGELELDTRRHSVTFDLDGVSSFSIVVHSQLLSAAIVNVLHNAVKHSPQGGCVRISTEMVVDHLIIAISDEGPGISPEVIAELHRSSPSGRSETAHSGLGLAIVQHAIDAHGGSIHVETPPSGGCHFKLSIPLEVNQLQN